MTNLASIAIEDNTVQLTQAEKIAAQNREALALLTTNPTRALELAISAAALAYQEHLDVEYAVALHIQAKAYFFAGEYASALSRASVAAQIFEERRDWQQSASAGQLLSFLYLEMGDFVRAAAL